MLTSNLLQYELRRACAEVGLTQKELAAALAPVQALPLLRQEDLELEDARWVHRDWLARALPGALRSALWPGLHS